MIILYVTSVVDDSKTGYMQTTLRLNIPSGSPLAHLPSTAFYVT